MRQIASFELVTILEHASHPKLADYALSTITDGSGHFDGFIFEVLLKRRGARLMLAQIVAKIKTSLTPSNLDILRDCLPAREFDELRVEAESAVSYEPLIESVRSRGSASIGFLSAEQRAVLFEKIREIVSSSPEEPCNDQLLHFLLLFEEGGIQRSVASLETIKLATEWCLQFPDDPKIGPVLSHILRMRPTASIIALGKKHQKTSDLHTKTTLLINLMRVDKKGNTERLKQWFAQAERNDFDSWLIWSWLAKGVSKARAEQYAKAFLKRVPRGGWSVLSFMLEHPPNKQSRRWLARFLKRNVATEYVHSNMSEILRLSPTKQNLLLARQVLHFAPRVSQQEALAEMLRFEQDEELVSLAKLFVAESPDAPYSFRIVCRLCKVDPAFAVPWLAEWAETAMSQQQYQAFASILNVTSELKYLEKAHSILLANDREGLPEVPETKANLLRRMLRHDRSFEFQDYIRNFLAHQIHAGAEVRRLAKCFAEVSEGPLELPSA